VAVYVKIYSESKVHKPNLLLLKIFVLQFFFFFSNLLKRFARKDFFYPLLLKILTKM